MSLLPESHHTSSNPELRSGHLDYVERLEFLCAKLDANHAAAKRRAHIMPRLLSLLGGGAE